MLNLVKHNSDYLIHIHNSFRVRSPAVTGGEVPTLDKDMNENEWVYGIMNVTTHTSY